VADPAAASRRAFPRAEVLAVVLIALAASLAGLANGFVQDDLVLIAGQDRIHDLGNWRALLGSPFWPPPYSQDLYRPLSSLLLALEWTVGGGSPLLYRLVSYGLSASVAVAVLLLGRRLLPAPLALIVALLFAAHPVHVEATALGVAQNELLVGILGVLMVATYLRARLEAPAGRVPVKTWAVLGALYVTAALLKETGLVLPGLLLAAELTFVSPSTPATAAHRRRLVPGYALLACIAAGVLLLRSAVFPGRLAGSFAAEALEGQGIGGRALTMLRVIPEWLRLLGFPLELQADYSPREIPVGAGFGLPAAVGLLLLVGAGLAAWLSRKRAPVVSFGLLWAGVALFPVSNVLVPTGIVLAERTLFLPSIGALLALGGLLGLCLEGEAVSLRSRPVLLSASLLGIAAGVVRSAVRQGDWRSESAYVVTTVQDAPRSWRAQRAHGALLFQQGSLSPALAAYDRALRLAPNGLGWRVRNDLALRFWEAGENREAARQLRMSRAEAPGVLDTRHYLVIAYLALGEYPAAMAEADSALARGGAQAVFGPLRALADTALHAGAPPGSIRVRIRAQPD